MNRSINILLMCLNIPALFFTILVAFEIPLFMLRIDDVSLQSTVYYVFAILMLLLMFRRTASRWVGISMMTKPEKFLWSAPVSVERKKNVRLYLGMETSVALFSLMVVTALTPSAWPLAIAYAYMVLDQLVFTFFAPKYYRVGITKKAVVVVDREVRILYFSGLRRVDVQQQTFYFDYIEVLQLFFPTNCIVDSAIQEFKEQLQEQVNTDKVFFTERFKALTHA